MEIVINYWAVLAAAVTYMVIGSLWYGPLFGKYWRKLMGFTAQDMKSMRLSAAQAIGLGFLSALVMAQVLAHEQAVWYDFMGATMSTFSFVFNLAFWLWLGFVATTQLGAVLWENRSWKLFFFNAASSLVSLFAMSWVITYLM